MPSSNISERKPLRLWLVTIGWDSGLPRLVCSMFLADLNSWIVSECLLGSLLSTEFQFDLVNGIDHAESIYQFALTDHTVSGII